MALVSDRHNKESKDGIVPIKGIYKLLGFQGVMVNIIEYIAHTTKDVHHFVLTSIAFCKREVQPLYKITENVKPSKRHVISMLRRIAKYNDNYLVQKRRTIYTDGKGQSQYLYALVRI